MNSNRQTDIETRLATLEAQRSVEAVFAAYFECVDQGYKLDELSQLLTDDLLCDNSLMPTVRSKTDFISAQREVAKIVEWAFHMCSLVSASVASDQETASGRWHVLGLHTMTGTQQKSSTREPVIYTAAYDVRFRKESGVWRISYLKTEFQQISRFQVGWVKEQFYAFES